MSENESKSRARRHQKQRDHKKKIFFFISLAALFCVILVSLIIFGNQEKQQADETEKSQAELAVENQEEHYATNEETDNNNDSFDIDEEEENDDEVDIKEVDSDDANVIKAYEGDWKPVGTDQTGKHVTNYDDHSDDREEIKKAVSMATDIDENNMTEHWVGNGGDEKVETTVSDQGQERYYRVYLSWIDRKGWQVTRIEELKEYEK